VFTAHSLFGPGLVLNIVNVRILIFVSVGKDFVVTAKERSLVERVPARHVSSLANLVELRVKQVAGSAARAVLLSTKD
jgi:hypothetical protein